MYHVASIVSSFGLWKKNYSSSLHGIKSTLYNLVLLSKGYSVSAHNEMHANRIYVGYNLQLYLTHLINKIK